MQSNVWPDDILEVIQELPMDVHGFQDISTTKTWEARRDTRYRHQNSKVANTRSIQINAYARFAGIVRAGVIRAY